MTKTQGHSVTLPYWVQWSLRVGPLRSDIKGTEPPPANILIPLERQLIALQLCHRQFSYNETLQQTFRPVLSKLFTRRQILVIYPHFEKVRSAVRTLVDGSLESPYKTSYLP